MKTFEDYCFEITKEVEDRVQAYFESNNNPTLAINEAYFLLVHYRYILEIRSVARPLSVFGLGPLLHNGRYDRKSGRICRDDKALSDFYKPYEPKYKEAQGDMVLLNKLKGLIAESLWNYATWSFRYVFGG